MGMNNNNTHGMVIALDVVNSALNKAGHAPIKKFFGRGMSAIATMCYHPIRRKLLCELMPEFAIKTLPEDGHRPVDGLRKLDNGTYVADVEDVTMFDDKFMKEFVNALVKKFYMF